MSSALVLSLLESMYKLSIIDSDLNYELADKRLFLNPESRVNEEVLLALWDFIDKNARVSNYGVLLGESIEPSTKGLLTSLLTQCESLGDALDTFNKYQDWINPSEIWGVNYTADYFEVTLSVDPSKGYPSSAIAKSLTSFLYWVRKLCNFNVMPLSATFSFDQPDHPDQFSATFGDDLTFFNNTNSLKFDNAHLNRKFKTSNPYIKSVLIKKITNEKNDYILNGKNDRPINKEVIYNLIEHNLKNNKANINTISSDLSISRQTLHRYLKNEGTSFKQILNDVRKDKSLRLLSNQNLTTTMVSEKLGYNEISSFYSAFKAWHGFTISDYKKTLSIE